MYKSFTHALARYPAQTAHAGLTTRTGNPDYSLKIQQYETYLQTLRDAGLQVAVLLADEFFPDGHYVEDAAVIYEDLAVVTIPGAESRRQETEALAPYLPQKHLFHMDGEARLDGGDVLVCANCCIFIGLSKRTNLEGARQLKHALQAYDSDVQVHFVPVEGVLHLKTGITELAPGVLVHDPAMKTDFDFSAFAEVVTLPPEEGYAANVLPINDKILIAAGFPTVYDLAVRYYGEGQVMALDMSEFEKMDGSLTCLSLRYRMG